MKELLARLKVQLRKQTPTEEDAPIVYGPLRLDPSTFELTYESREINLTVVEGHILRQLMLNAGRVVTYARLAEAVWGDEDYPGAVVTLRTYIRQLRQKLQHSPGDTKLIVTKPSVGYAKVQIKEAVNKSIRDRSVKDLDSGEKITIPSKSTAEPRFRLNPNAGERDYVAPGNKEFGVGDKIKKPPKQGGKGSGKDASDSGEGERQLPVHADPGRIPRHLL